MTEDTATLGPSDSQWGIFLNGEQVVQADNVLSVEYKQNWNLSDYPVEQGAFETYNKVQIPFDARVTFSSGGSEANRAALLTSIAAIAGDLNFYDVVTPEVTYNSVNITHYSYRRTAGTVGIMVVEVWLLQVRVLGEGQASFDGGTATDNASGTPTVTGSTVQNPSSADASNNGTVQTQTPNEVVSSDFNALQTSQTYNAF
jgi:hypothetical protein